MRRIVPLLAVFAVGCGDDGPRTVTVEKTTTVRASAPAKAGSFDPASIYAAGAPGVVTVYAGDEGLGSGFVLNEDGEIATNAHVVTDDDVKAVDEVFVEFSDGGRVPAEIRGFDADSDVALLEIEPDGLDLQPLPLGDSDAIEVGQPVAAIGSPFGERQSLTVGIVSAIDRQARSLERQFAIPGAIQTDAAINPGNSGGPLVDADGKVLGLNQSIETGSGTSAGVGFAVPINLAKRSIAALREDGKVEYAFLGVSSAPVYPQLAEEFDLPVERGALLQTVNEGEPADRAGLRAGGRPETFQAQRIRIGGDIVVKLGQFDIETSSDLSEAVSRLEPGREVDVVIYRDGKKRTVALTLGRRPSG